MSAGFTPGPWSASVEVKAFDTGTFWYVVLDAEENGLGEFYGDDHETNAANLRIAAAAPELYEALSRLLASCSSIPVGSGDGHTYVVSAPPAEALRIAAAALAKARGQS